MPENAAPVPTKYVQRLRKKINRLVEDLGYERTDPGCFMFPAAGDCLHRVVVVLTPARWDAQVDIQFGVSSRRLMELHDAVDLSIKGMFVEHVGWRLGYLIYNEWRRSIEIPSNEDQFAYLSSRIESAVATGHKLSMSLQDPGAVLDQMKSEPQTCWVHPLMREYLEGRFLGRIRDSSFTAWKSSQGRLSL